MNFPKAIDRDVKVNIAVQALKDPSLKTKDLAELFSVSETTVKRAKKDFALEAQLKLEEMQRQENEAIAAKARAEREAEEQRKREEEEAAKKAAEAASANATTPAPEVPKTDAPAATPKQGRARAEGSDIPREERGYKPRNGRWDVLNALFAEKGMDDAAALYIEANKRGVEAGLRPLNRGSFYSMLSMARKSAKEKAAQALTAGSDASNVDSKDEEESKSE